MKTDLFVTRGCIKPAWTSTRASWKPLACPSAEDDEAGQKWCEDNDFPGYTSYASLTDLPWRFPIFQTVKEQLDQHVAKFAEELCFDGWTVSR